VRPLPQVSRGIRALLGLAASVLSVLIVVTPSFNLTKEKPQAPGTPVYIAAARAYVMETASPGYTMTLQGAELAIGRLHPEFVIRLANTIREARNAGLPFAGVFSAYRPPAFGIGAFSDKFHSLHSYGLAVDVHGIGRPGSPEAQLWHEIAARNGVVCPYGPHDQTEWNHCQPTSFRLILAENPLRETIGAAGPSDLERMFEAGNPMIESIASAADSLSRAAPISVRALENAAVHLKPTPRIASGNRTKQNSRAATVRVATKSVPHEKAGGASPGSSLIKNGGRNKQRATAEGLVGDPRRGSRSAEAEAP
jgi:hypothetical protein